ncbi:MAG: response regulator [Desulfarculus sp.]|nr:response regulator [Desulfarculus sp.]
MTFEQDSLQQLRLLVAEDSEDDYLLLLGELERAGLHPLSVRVETAEAFRQALQKPWDLIVSDHHMPGFGGVQALGLRNQLAPDTPFIVVSGTIGEETAVEAMRLGASDYLMKNNLARLVPAIRRELAEAQQRSAGRQAEKELALSQERFRLVAQAASDVIYDWDALNDRAWFSDSLQARFGYQDKEVDKARQWWLERLHPEDRPALEKALAVSQQERRESWSWEYRLKRADGTWATVMDRGQLVYDPQGRPLRRVGALIDISEQRQLEEQFHQAQKMEVLGRLAAGVAHDFNNLLAVVTGYCSLLLEDLPVESKQRTFLEEMHHAGETGASLVRQLMAFSRKQTLKPVLLDLNSCIADVSKMLRQLIGQDVKLVNLLEDDLGQVRMDPSQLEQVLFNLAINARDAMPQGGSLTIQSQNVMLDGSVSASALGLAPGAYVKLTVSDTGFGMDQSTLQRIFEPFFTTKEAGKGTGLGLATVFGIVHQSGGAIGVESASGQGSKFEVYLPGAEETAQEEQAKEVTPESGRGQGAILVVDDTNTVRFMAKAILEARGYQVFEAGDGQEALRVCQEFSGVIRLVLTDYQMPVMGGEELVRRLYQEWPGLQVVMMSGEMEEGQRSAEAQSLPYLGKPFSAQDLTSLVRQVLDGDPQSWPQN